MSDRRDRLFTGRLWKAGWTTYRFNCRLVTNCYEHEVAAIEAIVKMPCEIIPRLEDDHPTLVRVGYKIQ